MLEKYKMSGMGYRTLCVVHAHSVDEAFSKARAIFGDVITGCQPWDQKLDSDNRDWLEIT